MIFETKRLLIRHLNPQDVEPFVQMASDGSLNDVGFGPGCHGWMQDWIVEAIGLTNRNNPREDYLAYAVVLKETDEVIGSVGCSYYKDLEEVGITYFIGAEYRGCGYATEAALAYVRFFFSNYNLSRIIATVREANVASWKCVEKIGFQLVEKKLYKDINDKQPEMTRFYEVKIV